VLLVIDGSASIQGKVFGLVFMRSLAKVAGVAATLTSSGGYTMTTEVVDGGSSSLTMNAGAVVYGAIVVQGQVKKANGTSSVVYNSDILGTLGSKPTPSQYVGVPGGWTDSVSY
jgi:hypothetical protein